jgi:SOS-response transcriptional repressor LexA
MDDSLKNDVCARIAQLRTEVTGPRGKSAFARQLGVPASTYDYYENGRVPPADVLVRVAEVTGVKVCWLLTGEAHCSQQVGADDPVLQRAARLLAKHPASAAPLQAFLEILEQTRTFPAKDVEGDYQSAADPAADPSASPSGPCPSTLPVDEPGGRGSLGDRQRAEQTWIPVLGRTAAGVPQFWQRDQGRGVPTLEQIVSRHAGRAPQQIAVGRALGEEAASDVAQVVTLTQPDAADVAEFVVAGEVKERYPDAFALRVDGPSMDPDIRHGDLVVLSPSAKAVNGRAAVVQLRNQIGVTCKIYRCEGERVHLVALSDEVAPVSVESDQVIWALRVLARIRA